MMIRLVLVGLAALSLSACGRQAQLTRPEPLVSGQAKKDYEAKRPPTPQETYDPASTQRSPRAAPIEGTNDPFGRPPSTSAP